MNTAVFWVVAPCSLVEVYQRFRGPCCLHHSATTQKTAILIPNKLGMLNLRVLLQQLTSRLVKNSGFNRTFRCGDLHCCFSCGGFSVLISALRLAILLQVQLNLVSDPLAKYQVRTVL
jgi:hypothetical protein